MRRKDREVHDFKKIMDIINKAKILRLGLFDGDYPYIVPLHYGHLYDEKEGIIFSICTQRVRDIN